MRDAHLLNFIHVVAKFMYDLYMMHNLFDTQIHAWASVIRIIVIVVRHYISVSVFSLNMPHFVMQHSLQKMQNDLKNICQLEISPGVSFLPVYPSPPLPSNNHSVLFVFKIYHC